MQKKDPHGILFKVDKQHIAFNNYSIRVISLKSVSIDAPTCKVKTQSFQNHL